MLIKNNMLCYVMLIKLYYDNNIIIMKLCVINEVMLVAYTLTEKFL